VLCGRYRDIIQIFATAMLKLRRTVTAILNGPLKSYDLTSERIVLLDLGCTPDRIAKIDGACPFDKGFYFQIEVYMEKTVEKNAEKSETPIKETVDSTKKSTKKNDSLIPSYRRYKGITGIIAEGGNFSDLIKYYKSDHNNSNVGLRTGLGFETDFNYSHLDSNHSNYDMKKMITLGSGIRFRLSQILMLWSKIQEKNRFTFQQSLKQSLQNIEMNHSNLTKFYQFPSSYDLILLYRIEDTNKLKPSTDDSSKLTNLIQYDKLASFIYHIESKLRERNLKIHSDIHQLVGETTVIFTVLFF
jgi:hypothetical protein